MSPLLYRLPSDHEWSCAVGIGEQEDAAKLPGEKSQKLADVFPWGGAIAELSTHRVWGAATPGVLALGAARNNWAVSGVMLKRLEGVQ